MSEFIGSLLTALSGFDSEITKPVPILKEHPRYGLISIDICHLVKKKKKKASSAAEESLYLVVYENLSLVIPFVTAVFFFPQHGCDASQGEVLLNVFLAIEHF